MVFLPNMGIIQRQGIKGTIVTYIGVLIGYVNLAFIMPYCLDIEQIGLTRILIDVATLFSFFAIFGMNGSITKFFPEFKDEDRNRGFFGIVVFLPLIGFTIVSIVYFVFFDEIVKYFSKPSPLLVEYSWMILPLTFAILFSMLFESYSNIQYRIVVPKIIKEVFIRLAIAILIILFFKKVITFDTFSFLFVAVYALATLLLLFYLKQIGSISVKFDLNYFTKERRKLIAKYSIFMILGSIGGVIVTKIDSVMLSMYDNGLKNVGIYTTAFFITSIVEIPSRSIIQISQSVASQKIFESNWSELSLLYKKTSLYQFLVGSFLFLLVWVNIDEIFQIMPKGEVFSSAKYVVLIIGFSKMFDALTSINMVIINNSKYYRVGFYFLLVLAVLTIVLNYFFIPIWGITGAAVSALISLAFYNIICVLYVNWKLKIHPLSLDTSKAIFIAILCYFISDFIPSIGNVYFDVVIESLVIVLFYLTASYYLKLVPEMNQMIAKYTSNHK